MIEYKIKYVGSIGCTAILIMIISSLLMVSIFAIAIYMIMDIAIIKNDIFKIITSYIVFILSIGGLILIIKYIRDKNKICIKFILNDEYLEINNGEKIIYYNVINNIDLYEYYRFRVWTKDRRLYINYNEKDEFQLYIYSMDKINKELFYTLYNEPEFKVEVQ